MTMRVKPRNQLDRECFNFVDSTSMGLLRYIDIGVRTKFKVDVILSVAIFFLEAAAEIDKDKTKNVITSYYNKDGK